MDIFFEAAPVEKKKRVHFYEFMIARHEFLREARTQSAENRDDLIARAARHVAKDAQLLCFDEVQVSDIADAMILGRLFERLFAEDVVIVATSNRPPRDLYRNGVNRQLFLPFIALLEAKLDIVELDAARRGISHVICSFGIGFRGRGSTAARLRARRGSVPR